MQETIGRKEHDRRLAMARECPDLAHLPAFGLVGFRNWNYHDPELEQRAAAILTAEGIEFTSIRETAPALFWYYTADGDFHLHDWHD